MGRQRSNPPWARVGRDRLRREESIMYPTIFSVRSRVQESLRTRATKVCVPTACCVKGLKKHAAPKHGSKCNIVSTAQFDLLSPAHHVAFVGVSARFRASFLS